MFLFQNGLSSLPAPRCTTCCRDKPRRLEATAQRAAARTPWRTLRKEVEDFASSKPRRLWRFCCNARSGDLSTPARGWHTVEKKMSTSPQAPVGMPRQKLRLPRQIGMPRQRLRLPRQRLRLGCLWQRSSLHRTQALFWDRSISPSNNRHEISDWLFDAQASGPEYAPGRARLNILHLQWKCKLKAYQLSQRARGSPCASFIPDIVIQQ